jgi:uncharacterized protein GlcG (DUF336 family)
MGQGKYSVGLVCGAFLLVCIPMLVVAEEVLIEKQISLSLAQEAALAAIGQCRQDGYRVSVTVVDRAGQIKVMLRDDGTGPHTGDTSRRKAYTSLTFRTSTIELSKRIASNPASANLKDISDVLVLGGGLPIKIGDEVIGAIGVGGAPGGDKDEVCAQAGIAKIADRLK